jgi:hypothetical protein
MKRSTLLAIASSVTIISMPALAADEPGRSGDPGSAEKQPPGTQMHPPEKSLLQEPGRSDDPASAEKLPPGTQQQEPGGPSPQEPGRTGDPASAEKRR